MKKVDEQLEIILKGAVDIVSTKELEEKLRKSIANGQPLKIKVGFDPTAPDLHLGHTVLIQKMRDFQQLGHDVIFLIGDFTGRIGDPSGKSAIRKPLTADEVQENAKTYERQIFKILDRDKTRIVFNNDWLGKMSASDLIHLSAYQTVARMLERDDFNNRFTKQQPISIHEFLYPLMQAYDSVFLKADVELGGTDQMFNLLMGREIQKKYNIDPQIVIMMPLLEGLDGVDKMSKSLGNYVGIDEEGDQIFGKIMSIDDTLMIKYYQLLTDLSPAEIDALVADIRDGKINPKDTKKNLAFILVERFWSKDHAERARERFEKVHENRGVPKDIPEFTPEGDRGEVWLVRFLADRKLVNSSSEARRLIKQGGVTINGSKVEDEGFMLDLTSESIIKVGKRRFLKVVPA
ncbi:MAG: tyrosine--tRNA ligase [bacterium]